MCAIKGDVTKRTRFLIYVFYTVSVQRIDGELCECVSFTKRWKLAKENCGASFAKEDCNAFSVRWKSKDPD